MLIILNQRIGNVEYVYIGYAFKSHAANNVGAQ